MENAVMEHPDFGTCVELSAGSLRAVVAPGLGMSLVDLTVGEVPILERRRKQIFLDYRKGLGPLIVPHFNQEREIPPTQRSVFPHAAHLAELGVRDPFQHGVGRYVPWSFQTAGRSVTGRIGGGDRYRGATLRELQGFDFDAQLRYTLTGASLEVAFDVSSAEHVVACGIHFYYDLVNPETARVRLPVREGDGTLTLPLDRGYDRAWEPRPGADGRAAYTLTTDAYTLVTEVRVRGDPGEVFDSVILFSPEGETFACIEPLSYPRYGENLKRAHRGRILLRPQAAG